eukprot:scaffold84852_cov50-Phaeocystis_antarctica.AAC.1
MEHAAATCSMGKASRAMQVRSPPYPARTALCRHMGERHPPPPVVPPTEALGDDGAEQPTKGEAHGKQQQQQLPCLIVPRQQVDDAKDEHELGRGSMVVR